MYDAYALHDTLGHAEALGEGARSEGELPIDIAETEDTLIITAPVAGADPEKISIHLNGDILTIRGVREREVVQGEMHHFAEECYWGNFSRSIILPVEVRSDEAQAKFRNGMLTLFIPKLTKTQHIPIVVIDE